MKRFNYKILSLIIAILVPATVILTACLSNKGNNSGTVDGGITEALTAGDNMNPRDDVRDDLPELDFNQREITISVMTDNNYCIDWVVNEEMMADTVNELIYKRNLAVEERLKVTLNIEMYQEGWPEVFAQQVLAEDGYYDIVNIAAMYYVKTVTSGMLADLREIEYINFDKPWWNSDIISTASINNQVLLATGELGFRYINGAGVFLFNKTLAGDLNLNDIYEKFFNGEWDYEMLNSYTLKAYDDLNGNSTVDEEDRFGYTADSVVSLDPYYMAFDQEIISMDENGYPVLEVDSEKMSDIVTKLYNFYWKNSGSYISNSADNLFLKDKTLFYATQLKSMTLAEFRDSPVEYGVLAYPKYDEKQEAYYTHNRNGYSQYGIALTCDDYDMAGAVLEASASENYHKVMPEYFETVMKVKYARDMDNDGKALDIIFANVKCDFAFYTDIMYILRNTVGSKNPNFASYYSKNENSFTTIINNIIDAVE